MRVLVTGKNGQVGRCLLDQGHNYGFTMFGMSSTELDITNIRNVDSVISQIKPDRVRSQRYLQDQYFVRSDNAQVG